MKFQTHNILYLLSFILIMGACDSKPRVIESESASAGTNVDPNSIPALDEIPPLKDDPSNEHKVVVEEVLDTDKYSYLEVSEDGEKYWVAITKREVAVGETYYFKGGLLKKNFFSKEFNRVFETVYLVSNIWKKPGGSGGGSALNEALGNQGGGTPNLETKNIELAEGAIKLSELFANKEKYRNQLVKISGKVVKVNPMIMSRNWLHIQDGSGDNLDLTVTTTENIALGTVVTLEGTIALDKDFGAGYRYDIIMEGAVLR